jgi:hypothetical protein
MSKASRNRQVAQEKIAQLRAEAARRRRRRNWLAGGAAAVVVAGAATGITIAATGGGSTGAPNAGAAHLQLAPLTTLGSLKSPPAAGPAGPEGVPVPAAPALAGISTAATGTAVDGISCQTSEQTLFHIHAHLAIFANGGQRQIPAAIGIPDPQAQNTASGPFIAGGSCFYWLHTHAADGIIHIESPVHRTYTLGDFFDEWGQALGPAKIGPLSGQVTALYNGQVFKGNPRNIPLTAHAQIQLEIGKPLIAPQPVSFPNGL